LIAALEIERADAFLCEKEEVTGKAMLEGWDAETYRERAAQWRREAERRPEGADKQACLELAAGYEHLLEIIERGLGQGPSSGASGAHS
jgi:hypothetical protein